MKLNKNYINICDHISERLNDEMVIFNEKEKKIIVLNQTATIIWDEIINCCRNGIDTTTRKIVSLLMEMYNLSLEEEEEVIGDVENTIDMLFSASLLLSGSNESD